ncbi:MAG TPA: hypothetical protein VEL69_08360 [Ktedonobacteraceae bacterium]|nr:hypothetical protein [Ktedonobacteraceae bacterium]
MLTPVNNFSMFLAGPHKGQIVPRSPLPIQAVYLLHFDSKLAGRAGHYIGYSADIQMRLHAHASGNGSKLMSAIARHDIRWCVARVWLGADRDYERKLHNRKESPRLCPICRGEVPRGWSVDVARLAQIATAQPVIATAPQPRKRQPMTCSPPVFVRR